MNPIWPVLFTKLLVDATQKPYKTLPPGTSSKKAMVKEVDGSGMVAILLLGGLFAVGVLLSGL